MLKSNTSWAPFFALGSMISFQLAAALSVPLLIAVGPSASTWLRLVGAAAVLWVVARPTLADYNSRAFVSASLLGIATCGMAMLYAEAIARIPLGMATAIEFLGPLAVAAITSRSMLQLVWVASAATGVALLALTSSGWSSDPLGIGFAMAAAACWAAYIILTKRVGQVFRRLDGLTISLTAAMLVATPIGFGQLRATSADWAIAASVALGFLIPVLPYGLEMLALRRLSARAFGILTSADPAISSLMGWIILEQTLTGQKMLGIACVVLASIGAVTASRASL